MAENIKPDDLGYRYFLGSHGNINRVRATGTDDLWVKGPGWIPCESFPYTLEDFLGSTSFTAITYLQARGVIAAIDDQGE
jgi:hypothetical protein